MEYNYNKLWKLLIDKNLMKKDLMEKTGITSSTIAKMGKNKAVSMEVLGKISMLLRKRTTWWNLHSQNLSKKIFTPPITRWWIPSNFTK